MLIEGSADSRRRPEDYHFFLPVKTPQLTINECNSLLLSLPLPVVSLLFPDPWTADSSRLLLLASSLTTVPVRCPAEFLMPMVGFLPPRLVYCLTQRRNDSEPTTIILRQKRLVLLLSLITESLQVNFPQTFHLNIHHIYHMRSLIMIPQDIYYHPNGHHFHLQWIHLITPHLLTYHPKVFIYLNILVWYSEFYHQDLILYHITFLPIPPVDTMWYQSSLQIHILKVLQLILTRSPYLLQAHTCALHNIFKRLTQHKFPVIHQSVHLILMSEMFHHQCLFFW